MRLYDLSPDDVARIVNSPSHQDTDPDGRLRFTAQLAGRTFRVVLGLDAPDLVVTVHERRR